MNEALRAAAIEEFNKTFQSPEGELSYDSETGGFYWITQEWETRDALEELFSGTLTDEAIESLAGELDRESPSWLDREEWATIDK